MELCHFDVLNNDKGVLEKLSFSGAVVLEDMEALQKEISSLDFSSVKELKISLLNVTEYDLSFLQLFKSFLVFLKKKQLSFEVEWPADQSLVDLLKRSGFSGMFELKE